jgi:hypothetical protein
MEKLLHEDHIMSSLHTQGKNNNKYEEREMWIVSQKALQFLRLLLLKSMDSILAP